jgi:hypothetical protein
MTGTDLVLRSLRRFPGRKALAWDRDVLYASERYSLWRWFSATDRWEFVAHYRPDWTRTLSSATRLGSRFRRDGFHSLAVLPNGAFIAILPKAIAICRPGQQDFEVVWRVRRGTRPLGLAALPNGTIYWGEYFDNPRRDEVHVYGSTDGGQTWDVVYTFARGKIRHIHSITYDPHAACLWMCTGDYGIESHIMRVSLDWKSVESVLGPGQQTRTVRPLPTPQGVFFATDSELEQNHVYRLTPAGTLEQLCDTSGACLSACQVGAALFFSTDVEPSHVNRDRSAGLYGSGDGKAWSRLVAWRKDAWHHWLFQFGHIILPTGTNDTRLLAATGSAVEREDGVMHLWEVTTA